MNWERKYPKSNKELGKKTCMQERKHVCNKGSNELAMNYAKKVCKKSSMELGQKVCKKSGRNYPRNYAKKLARN